MTPTLPPCPHDTDQALWEPVPDECGRYRCRVCGTYGRRVLSGDGNPHAPRGLIRAWKDGKLHPASGGSRRARPGDPRLPFNGSLLPRAYVRRPPKRGDGFIDPDPERDPT